MLVPAQLPTVAYSLAAVLAWGTSDFLGGYATRRANAFRIHQRSECRRSNFGGQFGCGQPRAPLPSEHTVAWALAAGVFGGVLHSPSPSRAFSGRMAVAAPVAAVRRSAAIPASAGLITQGLPGEKAHVGFGSWWWRFGSSLASKMAALPRESVWPSIGRCWVSLDLPSRRIRRVPGRLLHRYAHPQRRAGSHGADRDCATHVSQHHHSRRAVGRADRGIRDSSALCVAPASQSGRLDEAVVLSSLYPAITVLLAHLFLKKSTSPAGAYGIVGPRWRQCR